MQGVSYTCSHCIERIEDPSATTVYEGDCPIVVYMVAGLAPLHPLSIEGKGTADVTDFPMPDIVRELLSLPTARMEFCPECLAEKLGLPMKDAEGRIVKAKKK